MRMNDQSSKRPKLPRQRANLTIRPEYVTEARQLGINLSEVLERGVVAAIAEARASRWLEDNREALDSSNAWVESHGLPLAGKRLF